MSKADDIFIAMCQDIIENGTSTEGEKVRPIWTDTGESAYTVKKFGVVNRYNLQEEFPAVTQRRTAVKSATNEMLWIWQKKSNNINNLKSSVWDEWADEEGTIGKAYGYQIAKPYAHHAAKDEDLSDYPSAYIAEIDCDTDKGIVKKSYVYMDQIDAARYDLKNNPFSRRIIVNMYNLEELHDMHLYPCAYSMTFNVTAKKDSDKLILNGVLNQRSQDVLAANNWNVCQYSILLYMLARDRDMEVGELVHVIADAHIYDRHIPLVKELITRETYPAPKFTLNPDKKNFYDFTEDDIILEDYQHGPQIKNIPIAV